MNLDQTVASISDLDDDAIICVTRPWSATAACVVVAPDENLAVPQAVKNAGFEYFLEVYIAKEVLQVLKQSATIDDRVRLLLHYATHDAYPDWVYAG